MKINNIGLRPNTIELSKNATSSRCVHSQISFKNKLLPDSCSINNFYKIDNKLYRGRQPGKCRGERKEFKTDILTLKKDLQALKDAGIRTVIDLRYKEYEGLYPQVEGFIANRLGMKHHHIPMNGDIPTPKQIHDIFNIIDKSESPSFLHCRAGRDRTGMVLCVYSTYAQGKNTEDVLKEVFDDKNVQRFYYLDSNQKNQMIQIMENMHRLGMKNNSKIQLLTEKDLKRSFNVI